MDRGVILVQCVDLPLILQRRSGQQPRQHKEGRARGTAPQPVAALFLGIAGGQQIPQGIQRHGGGSRAFSLCPQQRVDADAQLGGQRLQIVQPRQGGVLLPLAQRLPAETDFSASAS